MVGSGSWQFDRIRLRILPIGSDPTGSATLLVGISVSVSVLLMAILTTVLVQLYTIISLFIRLVGISVSVSVLLMAILATGLVLLVYHRRKLSRPVSPLHVSSECYLTFELFSSFFENIIKCLFVFVILWYMRQRKIYCLFCSEQKAIFLNEKGKI